MHTSPSEENTIKRPIKTLLRMFQDPGMIHYSGSGKAAHQAPA